MVARSRRALLHIGGGRSAHERRRERGKLHELEAFGAELEGDSAGAAGRDQARLDSLAKIVKGITQSLR